MHGRIDMLEDTVYCNARNIIDHGGWNPNGGYTYNNHMLITKNYNNTTDLSCFNITDQFSISNNKASLIYPVGLLENEEANNITNNSLLYQGADWITMSPVGFDNNSSAIIVRISSGYDYGYNIYNYGIRPVITIKKGTTISSGTGSESNP